MLRILLGFALLIGTFSSAYANDPVVAIQTTTEIIEPVEKNILNTEVRDAIYALQHDFKSEDAPYIRFLTTFAIPQEQIEKEVLTCSYNLASLTGISDNQELNAGIYRPIAKYDDKSKKVIHLQRVKNSETLYWLDLRDYNFTDKAWEQVSEVEPFFVEPIVHHEENSLLRILAGNAVFRMDWFNYHTQDITSEINAGRNVRLYNILLYASTKEPKTVGQFEAIWGLNNLEKSRQLGNEYSALVTKSKNVALHNRLLFGYRTELGWLYRTYDTLSEEGFRDYVESIYSFAGKPPPPEAYDAGEIFASNQLKMQVFALNNNKEELIDFADPRIARHLSDVLGNPAVRVSHSCNDCHSAGPIPSENTLKEFLSKMNKLYVPKKGDEQRIERSMLNERFEEAVEDDQHAFARALLKVNGLEPDENHRNYLECTLRYDTPLGISDVCRECGISEEILKAAIQKGLNDHNKKVPGRLALLHETGEPIPRGIWDSPGRDGRPGIFQQTMSMIYGLTEKRTTTEVVENKNIYTVVSRCDVSSQNKTIGTLEIGSKVSVLKSTILNSEKWVQIDYNGMLGWILEKNIK
jgi:hypothetical protein